MKLLWAALLLALIPVCGAGARPPEAPGYTLALSWSPEFCKRNGKRPDARIQCAGGGGRYGFILHGLWPERRRTFCATGGVPPHVVRDTLPVMPSPELIDHEWRKHGSCVFSSADAYFRASRILFRALRFPDMDALSRRPLDTGDFARAFAAANRGLDPSAVTVHTNGKGWLEEVRLCLSARMRPEPCEASGDRGRVRIWRGNR